MAYFAVLGATLAEVYRRDDAVALVQSLAADLSRTSDRERLLFFHSEPIATAEDLTGRRPTPEMYEAYAGILKRLGWMGPPSA
jgi:hypothetical protein